MTPRRVAEGSQESIRLRGTETRCGHWPSAGITVRARQGDHRSESLHAVRMGVSKAHYSEARTLAGCVKSSRDMSSRNLYDGYRRTYDLHSEHDGASRHL